jgi:hypothetical protein
MTNETIYHLTASRSPTLWIIQDEQLQQSKEHYYLVYIGAG